MLRLARLTGLAGATHARNGRALSEASAVLDCEASEVCEALARCDLADRSGSLCHQLVAHPLQAVIAEVAHRRNAVEIAEMLQQGPSRDTRCADEVDERDRI